MQETWAVIVSIIFVFIVYTYIDNKITARRSKKKREKILPSIEVYVQKDVSYNVILNNGIKYLDVKLLGVSETNELFYGFGKVLVIIKNNGKRVFVRFSSIRIIEEV